VDVDPVRTCVGDGALEYITVIGAFHFINRIADLLHVDPEALPGTLRRFEPLRRLSVRVASFLMSRMDLRNRAYPSSYDETVTRMAALMGPTAATRAADLLRPAAARPQIVEVLRLALEERDVRSTLDRDTLATVHRVVEQALPHGLDEAEGFHLRPKDSVEAFAFIGTRYAYRTTRAMIDDLRALGYDDLGILDLAIAVADANQWARMHRLLGLDPGLFYVTDGTASVEARPAVELHQTQ
jgi:alkylhydroperoxidase family enzyme